jgi:hypothetical protein
MHEMPAGAMAPVGVVFLFLLFKTGKLLRRRAFLLVAAALFARGYW